MAEELKLKATAKARGGRAKLDTAKADAKSKIDAAAVTKDAAKEAANRKADTAKAASEAKLALEPVAVYISRATQKLYVRRNTRKPWPDGGEVFDATIEVPVRSAIPTSRSARMCSRRWRPLAPASAGPRSRSTTANDAKDALDRVTIPQDVLDRIAPTALPRSSIIVSDEPPSRETNYRTEFVAVLSNQPQGGFITRKPTIIVPPPSKPWDDTTAAFSAIFDQPRPQPRPGKPSGGAATIRSNRKACGGRGRPPFVSYVSCRPSRVAPPQADLILRFVVN